MTDTQEIDLQGCERCGKEFDIRVMSGMTDDGCWICEACDAEFRAHFAACRHEWEPHTNSFGEPSKYCHKCSGVVGVEQPEH